MKRFTAHFVSDSNWSGKGRWPPGAAVGRRLCNMLSLIISSVCLSVCLGTKNATEFFFPISSPKNSVPIQQCGRSKAVRASTSPQTNLRTKRSNALSNP